MKKKILVISITVVLALSVSAGVFAASGRTGSLENEKTPAEKATRLERIETAHRKIMYLFNEYYPEGVEGLKAVWEAHRDFHEVAREGRQALMEAIKEDRNEIKAAFESGEIDRTEARQLNAELRGNVTAMKTEFGSVIEEKKAAQQEVRNRMTEAREELKGLLTDEEVDETAVAELLNETLELFELHLDNDVLFHSQLQEIAANYGF